ncbi:MAG: hypothetical protein RIR06_1910 [Bacteroidota bacterium]|jgi:hypothetical protein
MEIKIEKIDTSDSVKRLWFERLVKNAYKNGWTYSSCTHEMWEDYVVQWNHFIDYIDRLKLSDGLDVVKILIGEAPPFYRATKKPYEKAYFYSPDETGNSPWFSAPLAHFCSDKKIKNKHDKLLALASKGVLLLDIFPFPIIQDTEMRTDITGEFADHLSTYFFPHVKSVLHYLDSYPDGKSRKLKIEWGITATKYAGTQLMLGENSRSCFDKNFRYFFNSPLTHPFTNGVYHKKYIRFFNSGIKPPPNVDYLDIPNWTMSNAKEVESPYFIFVVTLLFANRWAQWRQERKDQEKRYSQRAFFKFLYSDDGADGKVTLDQINKLLAEKPILPIFSTDKGQARISMKKGGFFNSK